MQTYHFCKEKIASEGFAIINDVFTAGETDAILHVIEETDGSGPAFRKTGDLFAIRQFLKEVPAAGNLIFTEGLKTIITQLFGDGYFVVKSIYFDKPAQSNWFVAYHQDLTISVDRRVDVEGFGLWTVKQNQFAVQPPVEILEDNFTIRIHLDDTDEDNGVLRVIPGSHLKGIYRPETMGRGEAETICSVRKGGIMAMKPLLMHSSGRTMNNNKRRVVHIEFSRKLLPGGLQWAEYLNTNYQRSSESSFS
jgi:hypothetical protein